MGAGADEEKSGGSGAAVRRGPPRPRIGRLAALLAASLVVSLPAAAHESGRATVRHRFPGVKKATSMYDSPDRVGWQKPAELVAALGIAAGMRVADVGAGTGFFEKTLSDAVGAAGTVYAVEVEAELVAKLRSRAEEEETANVVPVLGSFDDPRLPAAGVDVVLVVDTYHHVDSREAYFRRLRTDLAPGGALVVVDFEKKPLPVGPKELSHKLDRADVVRELAAAGWCLDRDFERLLPYQYVLRFRPEGSCGR